MVEPKPRIRVKAGSEPVAAALPAPRRATAFDAGRFQRRLRGVPTSSQAINAAIRSYGRTVLARSRYLAANNPFAAAAKGEFESALVGAGIKPSSLTVDAALKQALQQAWLAWTDEADADGLTDFYGLQAIIAGEMFEAGECFVRFRPRLLTDGFSVPLQLQVLPAEMLPIELNLDLGNGRRIECGIEFNAIGQRTAYHFFRAHPGNDQFFGGLAGTYSIVPAAEVMHLYKPMRAGQIRGIPHTLASIVTAAVTDQYEDAELERKKIAALFATFVTRPKLDDDHPLTGGERNAAGAPASPGTAPAGSFALEPGASIDLLPGEDVKFAEPADVGPNYEAFIYRAMLRQAAGYGVPYAAMTGDLRQTSYGSLRGGLVQFRRRIEAMQHQVVVFQLCRPVWSRWLDAAALAGVLALRLADFAAGRAELARVKWIPPKWDWIDPLKDRQAEVIAVNAGFKSRDDVVEEEGYDPEENDARIAASQDRAKELGLTFSGTQSAKSEVSAAPTEDLPPEQAAAA